MIKNTFKIGNIPAILWGKDSNRIIIAVHGSHSSKSDDCMVILAEEAVSMGYQVLSFDLPKHGDREDETAPCMVQACVEELGKVLDFAKCRSESISVFGCSMGVYFILLAYKNETISQCLFLSPVTDMERIIHNIMDTCNVSEAQLQSEKTIENPIETLYWDYYCYVKEHPVDGWKHSTSILYGEHDDLCEYACVSAFAKKNNCHLEVQEGGEHWFHTPEELEYYRGWLKRTLKK